MRQRICIITALLISFSLGVVVNYVFFNKSQVVNKTVEVVETKIVTDEEAVVSAIDKVYDSVLVVETYEEDDVLSVGAGFVYKKDTDYGYVITNAHVIEDAKNIRVILSSGKQVEATLLGSEQYSDIAVLSIPSKEVITVCGIGDSRESKLGSTVFAIGSPISSEYSGTITRGILSKKDRLVSVSISSDSSDFIMKLLQTDAAINPGNSGGPLINLSGEVIGINSLKLVQDKAEGISFAIPIEDAMFYVEKLENKEAILRPVLGVNLLDLDDDYGLYIKDITIDDSITYGAVIADVIANSSAEKAGFIRGDVVVKINDEVIKDKAKLRYELYRYEIGDKVSITYNRNSVLLTTDVVLLKGE